MPDLGIGELLVSLGVLDAGATATAIGTGLSGALYGAGGGALLGAITGGDPGKDALIGGLSGGFGGVGEAVGPGIGIGADVGQAIGGAAGGALGGGITGANPIVSAAEGALPGLVNVGLGAISPTTPALSTSAPGAAAASVAGPAGAGGDIALDPLNASPTMPGPLTAQDVPTLGTTGTLDSVTAAAGGMPTYQSGLPTGTARGIGTGDQVLPAGGGGGGNASILDPIGPSPTMPGPLTTQTIPSLGMPGALTPQDVPQLDASIPQLPWLNETTGQPESSVMSLIHDPSWSRLGTAASENLGPIISGAGLLKTLATPNNPSGLSNLQEIAASLQNQGKQFENYINTGTLPPGAQAQLDVANKGAEARIKSLYASYGMSGSSAEAQDLANLKLQTAAQSFQIADSLLKTGIEMTGMSSQDYAGIVQLNQARSKATGDAIANFASALAGGGGKGITLNIPGAERAAA